MATDASIITLHYVTNDLTDPIYALEAVYSPKEQTITWILVMQSQGSSYGNYVHFYININDPAGTVLANLRDYKALITPHHGDKAQPIDLVQSTQPPNPDWPGGVNLVTDDGIYLYGDGMAVLSFTTDFTGESVADLNKITMDLKVWSTFHQNRSAFNNSNEQELLVNVDKLSDKDKELITSASTSESTSLSQSVVDSMSASESASTSASESASMSASESASTSASESASTSASESASTSASESASTSASESASTSASESASTSASESNSESNSESLSESNSESNSESTSESGSESNNESLSESGSESNSESLSESNSPSDSDLLSGSDLTS